MGRVRDLLLVRDVFQLRAKDVSAEAADSILAAARRAGAEVLSAEHPTTTLEDLFLRVIRPDPQAAPSPPDADRSPSESGDDR